MIPDMRAPTDLYRAIFQSSLLLLCFLTFVNPPAEMKGEVDILDVNDWRRLARICDNSKNPTLTGLLPQLCQEDLLQTRADGYVCGGAYTLKIKGILDGKERMLDMVRYVPLSCVVPSS